MKNFIHHDLPKLKRIDSEKGRVYQTPTGDKYPSVTSVSGLKNAKAIQAWRNRVGVEAANKISSKAAKRGTAIHSLCEQYLLTEKVKPDMVDVEMWKSLKPHLDRINNIHCTEAQLFSHDLQVAGTVDCIAEYDGQLSVIDFKTASKPKTESMIDHYFMQAAAYSVMFEEMTSIVAPRLLIIIGVDDQDPQVFEQHRDSWIEGFRELREEYRKLKGV